MTEHVLHHHLSGLGTSMADDEEAPETFEENGVVRIRNTEFVLPICVGTIAFWLGKKASEEKSHRWTVYVRSPLHDDLSHILDSVTFRYFMQIYFYGFIRPHTLSHALSFFRVWKPNFGGLLLAVCPLWQSCSAALQIRN